MSTDGRAPRNSLNRELLLTRAVHLADRDGLAALTIRALAEECGVKPMAVYHHIANKDAILDAIVDAVFAEIHLASPDRPWRDELALRCRSVRAALGRHPWALSVLETRRTPGPASLRAHESCLDVLRSAGFSLEATGHAFALLDAFVFGFALQEAMLSQVGLETGAAELADGMDLSASPRIAEFATEYAMLPGYSFGASFEVGLDLVLDGLERLRLSFPAPSAGDARARDHAADFTTS